MREKIADICDNEMISTSPSCYSLADAIIAALPDMIKPLDWAGIYEYGTMLRAKCSVGFYTITLDEDSAAGRAFVEWHVMEDSDCTVHAVKIASGYDDDELKAAANAHHVATIMGAFE